MKSDKDKIDYDVLVMAAAGIVGLIKTKKIMEFYYELLEMHSGIIDDKKEENEM